MFLLFSGPNEFAAQEALNALRATGGFEHNQDTFAGGETDLATIRNTANTLPFLTERRLVVVRGLPKRRASKGGDGDDASDGEGTGESTAKAAATTAPSRGKGKKKAAASEGPKAFAQGLADLATELPTSTVLVLIVDETLDASSPLMQAAKRAGEVRTFPQLKGAQLESWLTARAKSRNATLAPDAARLLIEVVGEQTRLLASEIEKLSAYVGPGGRIGVEEVHQLTPAARELNAFDLTDALVRRERVRALTLLHELLAGGSAPLQIVGMIAYQTRTLMQVRALSERGMRSYQIAQTAGISPFVVEKSLGLASQFTQAELEHAHRTLFEIDVALKRSRMTPEMALDLLVVEFGRTA